MLNSPNNIFDYQPPFIFTSANNEWLLVAEIKQIEEKISLLVVEKIKGILNTRTILLDETPFHVGAEIWELNYGATLMTLNHSSIKSHPAKQLWQEWLKYKNN